MINQYFNSHALCFYFDTFAAALLYYLATYCTPSSSNSKALTDKVVQNVAGIFGHGLGHAFLWITSSSESQNVTFFERSLPIQIGLLIGSFLFWLAFFRSVHVIPKNHATLHSLIHAISLQLLVPITFSFTYVQTVLLLTVGFFELTNKNKCSSTYNAFSLLVNLPIGFVGWLESLSCDSWLVGYGGHVLYDATIPISILMSWAWVAFVSGDVKGKGIKSVSVAANSPATRTRSHKKEL